MPHLVGLSVAEAMPYLDLRAVAGAGAEVDVETHVEVDGVRGHRPDLELLVPRRQVERIEPPARGRPARALMNLVPVGVRLVVHQAHVLVVHRMQRVHRWDDVPTAVVGATYR